MQTDYELKRLIREYKRTNQPIEVNFRDLVQLPYQGDRATHLLHPYPAKLLPNIPYFFLNNSILSKPEDLIFDPFCGSGSVLVEAILAGRASIGLDSNPLAVLLAKAKTTAIPVSQITAAMKTVNRRYTSMPPQPYPAVINLNLWFSRRIALQLSKLKAAIAEVNSEKLKTFLNACFSVCVRRLSRADPRVSVPVRLKKDQYSKGHPLTKGVRRRVKMLQNADAFDEFAAIVNQNMGRVAGFSPKIKVPRVYLGSVLELGGPTSPIPPDSVRLIVTSPPYAGAQKYIRACSLSLNWLGLCSPTQFRSYERQSIGREHYAREEYRTRSSTNSVSANAVLLNILESSPLRAHIAANYINEMEIALTNMLSVLQPGGNLVLVTGNNQICGQNFDTTNYLLELAVQLGFKIRLRLADDIKSWGLMTKRNKTAGLISREWVTLLEK